MYLCHRLQDKAGVSLEMSLSVINYFSSKAAWEPVQERKDSGANITAISINPDTKGNILWTKNYPPADGNMTRTIVAVDLIANTFVTEDKENLEFNGFSLDNGNHLWTAQTPIVEWDTLRRDTLSAYGNLYAAGYDGIVYCFNDATGDLLWTYGRGGEDNSTYSGENTVYGHYPVFIVRHC